MAKKFWLLMVGVLIINLTPNLALRPAIASDCPDVKIIFARGSGEDRWTGKNYQTFKDELSYKLALTSLNYEFEDLDYPAIDVSDPLTLLSTFVSGGEAYKFGESVAVGVKKIVEKVSGICKNTSYVLAGYSQGAMLISKAINLIPPEKIIYAATFGDPKIYLPEGKGFVPSACSGKNLSNYRIYVPDCRVYEGLLGGYRPYQPEGYFDKLGTWCNKTDIFCSTHFSIDAHTSYVKDGLYADASKIIFDKICQSFKIPNNFVSLHDTAILIDSTGSMNSLIKNYEAEALNLAEKTLANGGRVALYDYRDLADGYKPVMHCNFETCDLAKFKQGLEEIVVKGGGDSPESLLSSSFTVMKELNWRFGSTKSLVVLTDEGYHNPDLDGVSFDDVVALSKSIDPVNFYIITPRDTMDKYAALATATDGKVVNSAGDLNLLTQSILARYDALPRVEESFENSPSPEILNLNSTWVSENTVEVSWETTGEKVMVILNDAMLGMSENNSITISGLDPEVPNQLRLVPIGNSLRGEGKEIDLSANEYSVDGYGALKILKAPNAGKR